MKARFHRANRLMRAALTEHLGTVLEGAFPILGARCDQLSAAVLERLKLPPLPVPGRDRRALHDSPP